MLHNNTFVPHNNGHLLLHAWCGQLGSPCILVGFAHKSEGGRIISQFKGGLIWDNCGHWTLLYVSVLQQTSLGIFSKEQKRHKSKQASLHLCLSSLHLHHTYQHPIDSKQVTWLRSELGGEGETKIYSKGEDSRWRHER